MSRFENDREASRAGSGRRAAALALAQQLAKPGRHARAGLLPVEGLPPAEVAKAYGVYRDAMRHRLSLTWLLDVYAKPKLDRMEPMLQGVLLAGAAELMEGDTPAYAVLNSFVDMARDLVRPKAAGLVNALLHRVGDLLTDREETLWQPAEDRLPWTERRVWRLAKPILPPVADWRRHLSVAASCPVALLDAWAPLGEARVRSLALAGLEMPETVVHHEPELEDSRLVAHEVQGFSCWRGPASELSSFLSGHPERCVQDPSASQAVRLSEAVTPQRILDLCAGRGTKTRQLARLHPDAKVVATDIDSTRCADLAEAMKSEANVQVSAYEEVSSHAPFDLVLLDVPCSNTGVLARRVEARYRFSAHHLGEVIGLQRRIVRHVKPWLQADACVLWSTCSIQPEENEKQVAWIVKQLKGQLLSQRTVYPGGSGEARTDGAFHALIRLGDVP